jgi:integrase
MDAVGLPFRSFYDRYFEKLFLLDARPATILEYRVTLKHFLTACGDVALDQVDPLCLASFKAYLLALPGRRVEKLSPATVNKHITNLNAILSKAGPPGPRNRDALGVLERIPWLKPVREERRRPRVILDDWLNSFYEACSMAINPRFLGSPGFPQLWWRSFLVTAVNIGYRRTALLSLTWSNNVDFERRIIRLPASIDKAHCDREKPMNSVVFNHLSQLQQSAAIGDKVFPWPHCLLTLNRQWHRIQSAAGLPKEQHYKLHDLKRTCGTKLSRIGSPWAVQEMLDHSSIKTSQHYIDALPELAALVEQVPQPSAFQKGIFR